MCGISGILHWGSINAASILTEKMVEAIHHRGPDDRKFWNDGNISLGFARLSILDLQAGVQPMCNEDGRVWITFNGEIYNHKELRAELCKNGHIFKTDHSDTEVLLHGWEQWKTKLPERLNGMFAFSIWDQNEEVLFIARDRYGIKPLYTFSDPNVFLFSSEIKGLLASGLIEKKINYNAVFEYFSQQNTWTEQTMFANIKEFPAGTWNLYRRGQEKKCKYWDFYFDRTARYSLPEAAEIHRALLQKAVNRQIVADVPVNAYLSGGIDSSAIVSAAHKQNHEISAYSCIFDLTNVGEDKSSDEREFSRLMANSLGIKHYEMELKSDALIHSLDATVNALETLRMGISYENFLIARRVAQDCKVVLSGTGGDELHGGYLYRYQAVSNNASTHKKGSMGRLESLKSLLRYHWRTHSLTPSQQIYFQMLNFPISIGRKKSVFTSDFMNKVSYDPEASITKLIQSCPYDDPKDMLMYIDAKTYLHGLLVLEDKLSMANSLEARVPLLDNELVDFVCTLPWSLMYDGKIGKIIFRESVKPWVPKTIYQKPKMGFGPPEASWYRTTLRPFIHDQLNKQTIEEQGIFQYPFIQKCLDEHFSGAANHLSIIWSLLSFSSWQRNFNMTD